MRTIPIHPFKGLDLDTPARFIGDNLMPVATNVVIRDGKISIRPGYTQLGSSLVDKVTAIVSYDPFFYPMSYVVAFTLRDAFYYDLASSSWKYITKRHYAGKASCAGSTTAVVGSSTPAWSTLWPASRYYIKFGNQDPNTAGTWYLIASFGSATALTLATNGPNTGGAVDYVIRMCFNASDDQYPQIAQSVDEDTWEKVLIYTNYVDPPLIWEGTAACGIGDGFLRNLGGTPPTNAKAVGAVSSRVFLGNVIDGAVTYPQTVFGSAAGDPEDWTTSPLANNLVETDDEVLAILPWGTSLFVYKEKSITEIVPTYDATNPFVFYEKKFMNGLKVGRGITQFGNAHILRGDNDFYVMNGSSMPPIGSGINNTITGLMNDDTVIHAFAVTLNKDLWAFFFPEAGQTYPSVAVVFNMKTGEKMLWRMAHAMTAGGSYQKQGNLLTCSDSISLGTTGSDYLGITCLQSLQASSEIKYALGDEDGNVYELDETVGTDNGINIDMIFETCDHPSEDYFMSRIFERLFIGIEAVPVGNIIINISTDAGTTWSSDILIPLTGSGFIELVAAIMKRGKRIRIRGRNVNGSQPRIESLMLGYSDDGEEMRGGG